jgi:hypothetical protein
MKSMLKESLAAYLQAMYKDADERGALSAWNVQWEKMVEAREVMKDTFDAYIDNMPDYMVDRLRIELMTNEEHSTEILVETFDNIFQTLTLQHVAQKVIELDARVGELEEE